MWRDLNLLLTSTLRSPFGELAHMSGKAPPTGPRALQNNAPVIPVPTQTSASSSRQQSSSSSREPPSGPSSSRIGTAPPTGPRSLSNGSNSTSGSHHASSSRGSSRSYVNGHTSANASEPNHFGLLNSPPQGPAAPKGNHATNAVSSLKSIKSVRLLILKYAPGSKWVWCSTSWSKRDCDFAIVQRVFSEGCTEKICVTTAPFGACYF